MNRSVGVGVKSGLPPLFHSQVLYWWNRTLFNPIPVGLYLVEYRWWGGVWIWPALFWYLSASVWEKSVSTWKVLLTFCNPSINCHIYVYIKLFLRLKVNIECGDLKFMKVLRIGIVWHSRKMLISKEHVFSRVHLTNSLNTNKRNKISIWHFFKLAHFNVEWN